MVTNATVYPNEDLISMRGNVMCYLENIRHFSNFCHSDIN